MPAKQLIAPGGDTIGVQRFSTTKSGPVAGAAQFCASCLPAMTPAAVTPAAIITRSVAVIAVVVRPPPAPAIGVADPADLIDVGDRVSGKRSHGHGGSGPDKAAEQQRGRACELEFGHVRFLSGSSPFPQTWCHFWAGFRQTAEPIFSSSNIGGAEFLNVWSDRDVRTRRAASAGARKIGFCMSGDQGPPSSTMPHTHSRCAPHCALFNP